MALFLAFCLRLNIPPYNLHHDVVCCYIEYLCSHISAPATVRNKISQLRTHFQLLDISLAPLNHIRVSRAMDAIDRRKSHIPRVKLPLEPADFYLVLANIPKTPVGNLSRAIFLTLYYGVLRQSELLPRSVNAWDPNTQPTRGDVSLSSHKCTIFIKKAKNMQRYDQNRTVSMQPTPNNLTCPVSAMYSMFNDTPTFSLSEPVFMFPESRTPVPATFALKQLHGIMAAVGLDDAIDHTSLHSIRKSAATDAYMAGCSEHSIRSYGGWSSSAYRTYIQTSNSDVNRCLIQQLSNN